MAYDATNKRVYIDASVTPNVGVSIADVKTALSESSNDLGTLCTSSRINHFSAAKPVRSSELLVTDFASENYGFKMDYDGTSDDIVCPLEDMLGNAADNPEWALSYLRPRGYQGGSGGSNEWYRLLDFNGYVGTAQSPVVATKPSGDQSPSQSSFTYTLEVNAGSNQPMNIENMDVIQNWSSVVGDGDDDDLVYVLLYRLGSGTTHYIVGNSLYPSGGGFNGYATFNFPTIQQGQTVTACVAIVSLESISDKGVNAIGLMLPSTYTTFRRVSPSGGIVVSNVSVMSHGVDSMSIDSVDYAFTIQNGSQWPIRIVGLEAESGEIETLPNTRYRVNATTETDFSDEGAGMVIAAGASATISGTLTLDHEVEDPTFILWLNVNYASSYDSYAAQYSAEVFGDSGANWGNTLTTPSFIQHPEYGG